LKAVTYCAIKPEFRAQIHKSVENRLFTRKCAVRDSGIDRRAKFTYKPKFKLPMGVLVAISIPIFTAQLEKAREATDAANIRAAYAAVSTDVLEDSKANDAANGVTYSGGKYTATVTATQTKANWQTSSLKDGEIGGQKVAAQTKGNKWTITGDVEAGTVTITPAATIITP
jgi:hypothetical protein